MEADEKSIYITENMTWDEKCKTVETALFIGFHTVSAHFPIAALKKEHIVPRIMDELQHSYENKEEIPENYVCATDNAKPIQDFDWRKKKGLETLFSEGSFLQDTDLDLLPDKLSFKIAFPKESSTSVIIAACNFAFRFGMETTAYEGPIMAPEGYIGNLLLFEKGNECSINLEERQQCTVVHVTGEGQELEDFSSFLCENFPLLADRKTWIDQLQYFTDSFAMKNLDGQLAYLKAFEPELKGKIKAFFAPDIQKELSAIEKEFPKVEFHSYKEMKPIYERTYDIPWEVDVFEELLEKEIYPYLKSGDKVEIYGALSEEKAVRDALTEKIKDKLLMTGAVCERLQLICAYKQGISWIEEVMLPRLMELKKTDVSKVIIAFKAFLPKGERKWIDEDGAVPSYNNIKQDDPDYWYDLPIRFLQELYPVEDIISEELGINRDNIELIEYKGNKDITYLFQAYDKAQHCIIEEEYKAAYTERQYLDEYPQMGKVHPSTGYLCVVINGTSFFKRRIATDLENIWDIYQSNVLPECREFIDIKVKGKPTIEQQPFFSRLQLQVTASEPNYRLNSREDMISSLDALHEDMYFVGSDYFKNYGIRETGAILDAPGLILPIIKKAQGKPTFKVTLYDQMASEPCICSQGREIHSMVSREQQNIYINKINYENKQLNVQIKAHGADPKIVKAYADLLNRKVLCSSRMFKGINKIIFDTKDGMYTANIVSQKEQIKDLDINSIDLYEHKLIGYDEYMKIICMLKRVPGIAVYKAADSYMGREIYAIELLPKESGYVSRTKRITYCPSEIINCRHHANEVSSTNAAFMLIKKLLVSDEYKELPNKLNLVIVPMENVDGAAIHYELQKDNPHWKLHVARFNAIGKEFSHEVFKNDTIHSEAKAQKWLWRTLLPDVSVDNHGVPSHEWEQQFSGYTSPSFKGFWLPRSLLYGYYWTVTDEAYKSNYAVNKKIEEVVAEAIGENEEITSWNKEWAERFEKFAHGWMPKLFPADYYKDMINYWVPFSYNASHRYPSVRFPWITTVAYTSEVADETAQGEYLNLCARAHVQHDLAIIKMLMHCKCVYKQSYSSNEGHVIASCIRQRPIIV